MFEVRNKNGFNTIKVNDLREKIGNIELIDIREAYEYSGGHIPSAKNIPMKTIVENMEDYLDKDKEYYIVCKSGGRSLRVCSYLFASGYNVINVFGGTDGYLSHLER